MNFFHGLNAPALITGYSREVNTREGKPFFLEMGLCWLAGAWARRSKGDFYHEDHKDDEGLGEAATSEFLFEFFVSILFLVIEFPLAPSRMEGKLRS
jgi:hypothetical protein